MNAPRLCWLEPGNPDTPFPAPHHALVHPNGLLAAGGDLSAARLQNAYANGIFPWYEPSEPILWWSPDPRTVFRTDRIHVSRRLVRTLAQSDYQITFDTAFRSVVDGCAAPRSDASGTWISADMRAAYVRLFEQDAAHSIEVWRDGRLIGGLYGVTHGPVFFGESMFSCERDASKIALVWLGRRLADWGYQLIDAQIGSDHLYRMGAFDMPRDEFLRIVTTPTASVADHATWCF